MRLVKDNDVFVTDDKTVIRAFMQNGYKEEAEVVDKPQPKASKKKPE